MSDLALQVPRRALAVYAHPADAEVACGGTLSRWAAEGCAVALVVCTRGDKGSHDPSADPERLVEARADEVGAACAALGVAHHEGLGYRDGEIENVAALRERLVRLVRHWRPEVVLSHDPTAVFFGDGYVNHRDHRVVGEALLDAVAPAAGSPLYFPDAGPAHRPSTLLLTGTLVPDTYLDVEEFLDRKASALRCHVSQLGEGSAHVAAIVEDRAREAGGASGLRAAESFRRIRLA